ncbi:MAG: VacJ family lipoprotein [Desulfobacterales bacterium]|nr:MAG: VacJ family lipoprotein [Desulfobacterales bacterium]
MRTRLAIGLILALFGWLYIPHSAVASAVQWSNALAQQNQESTGDVSSNDDEYEDDEYADDEYDDETALIADPLYGFNKGVYYFNDKLYFWLLKPVARGYKAVVPVEIRTCIRNVADNLRFPIRFVNALLQGKVRKAGSEFGRFFINSVVGLGGLADIAHNYPALNTSQEDLGQTFAVWGFGNGLYLNLPLFGPSSARDAIGRLGDTFLDPIWWLIDATVTRIAIRGGETVNETSFRIGDYEALKEAALDPYIAIRNAYVQNRNKLIQE